MPKWLDSEGYASIAIAVCDRCKMKRVFSTLHPDVNFPGLRVCEEGCMDEKDPYRLPARKTERINLRFPRPDVSVAVTNDQLVTSGYGQYIISTSGNPGTKTTDGNENQIVQSP